ncbi:MAG: triose-phosphate isomerase [Gammaproteobacteria bacterium]
MRRSVMAGNWKMQGTRAEAVDFARALLADIESCQVDVVFLPPAVYLDSVAQVLKGSTIAWGAQDVSSHEAGAYTGDHAASMLTDLECRYVLVGHSERRQYHGETDAIVAEKFAQSQRYGLIPILCLGETLEQRQKSKSLAVVIQQLDAVVTAMGGVDCLNDALVAYEPIWAIGTGKTATPQEAQEVHKGLRAYVAAKDEAVASRLRILYGGSVNGKNAKGLLKQPDIDGALVGSASRKQEEFCQMIRLAEQ